MALSKNSHSAQGLATSHHHVAVQRHAYALRNSDPDRWTERALARHFELPVDTVQELQQSHQHDVRGWVAALGGAKEAQFVRCSADTNTKCEREREARAELAFPIINRLK